MQQGSRDRRRTPAGSAGGLEERLREREGAPYPAYRDLRGLHDLSPGGVVLEILHVQPDPFAPPSILRVTVPLALAGLPLAGAGPEGTTAIEDFLARRLHAWLREREEIGSIVGIDPPSQQILRRTALRLAEDRIELLLEASLPARGRRIEGRRAAAALAIGIPRMIRETLFEGSWDAALLARHRAAAEDHAALQSLLARHGWVAFLADGSRLARRSGEEDVPLEEGNLPLEAPDSLAGEVALPHAGRLRGLAIPRGITLLSGGGFHGKSTVLRSLAAAVWPHVPGDGRERVATDPTAMMIRAEDGRSVHGVDLSPFLRNLPGGRDVRRFTTANASGATSQAASIVEAIAAGCRCLLIDEDTSATNFLLRDPWMARLLRPEQEPIVPLLSRLREMYTDLGISTVLVVGGSGEAFRAADRVVVMDAYRPVDETRRMVEIRREMGPGVEPPRATWPEPRRDLPLDRLRARDPRVRATGLRRVRVGTSEIDLSSSGALVHPSQARTLATALAHLLARERGPSRLPDLVDAVAKRIAGEGPGAFAEHPRGDLAEVRSQEIAMLFDRLRISPDETDRARGGEGRDLGGVRDARGARETGGARETRDTRDARDVRRQDHGTSSSSEG